MTIEAAIRTQVLANSAVVAMIGARMWPGRLPPGTFPAAPAASQPAITYERISITHFEGMGMGSLGAARARYQFNCWANTLTDAWALKEAIRLAIQGFIGTMGGAGGVLVGECSAATERGDIQDPDPNLRHASIDFFIFHAEAVPV